jgi:hypothetical protein
MSEREMDEGQKGRRLQGLKVFVFGKEIDEDIQLYIDSIQIHIKIRR